MIWAIQSNVFLFECIIFVKITHPCFDWKSEMMAFDEAMALRLGLKPDLINAMIIRAPLLCLIRIKTQLDTVNLLLFLFTTSNLFAAVVLS